MGRKQVLVAAIPGNWMPNTGTASAGITDNGSRVFTTNTAGTWRGIVSTSTYTGAIRVKTIAPAAADVLIALSTNANIADPYNTNVGAAYFGSGGTAFTPQRNGGTIAGTSSTAAVLTPGTSYVFVERTAGNLVRFGYSANGTGNDEVVYWSDADPSTGGAVYMVVGMFTNSVSMGPVVRS